MRLKAFFLFFLLLFFKAYSQIRYDVERATISIKEFNSLKVYSGLEVKLIPSEKNMVYVYGDNIEKVIISLKRKILKIKLPIESVFKTGYNYIEVFYNNNLEVISAYQGSTITNKKTIKTTQINIKAKEGSNISAKINVDNLKANVSSGGKLSLTGNTNEINLKVSAGGLINAEKLESNKAKVISIAGGSSSIRVRELANLNINAGGKIEVYGKPKRVISKYTLGGKVLIK
tara:strand:- start:2372 stop:3064 length:693 start_codon:yes stop_codon:yes gene_type:complete